MKLLTLLLLSAALMQSQPQAGEVLIVGNITKPGAFAVMAGGETTVLKMLSMAEGLTPFSAKQVFIYRRNASTLALASFDDNVLSLTASSRF